MCVYITLCICELVILTLISFGKNEVTKSTYKRVFILVFTEKLKLLSKSHCNKMTRYRLCTYVLVCMYFMYTYTLDVLT